MTYDKIDFINPTWGILLCNQNPVVTNKECVRSLCDYE